jgi:hypothetical protein
MQAVTSAMRHRHRLDNDIISGEEHTNDEEEKWWGNTCCQGSDECPAPPVSYTPNEPPRASQPAPRDSNDYTDSIAQAALAASVLGAAHQPPQVAAPAAPAVHVDVESLDTQSCMCTRTAKAVVNHTPRSLDAADAPASAGASAPTDAFSLPISASDKAATAAARSSPTAAAAVASNFGHWFPIVDSCVSAPTDHVDTGPAGSKTEAAVAAVGKKIGASFLEEQFLLHPEEAGSMADTGAAVHEVPTFMRGVLLQLQVLQVRCIPLKPSWRRASLENCALTPRCKGASGQCCVRKQGSGPIF